VRPLERSDLIKAAEDRFDLIIIGGGAVGAGILLEAQSRGLRTLLVEKHDFGAQTSSRSTKLAHGGVRYLQAAVTRLDRGQWALVREALRERAVFFRIAPHLARELELIVPAYRPVDLPYLYAGLRLYDLLAGRHRLGQAKKLTPKEARSKVPTLKTEDLVGAVAFKDGQFDDARMNLALVLTATGLGGVALNHASARYLIKENGRVVGVGIKDELTGDVIAARAPMVVNAAGPFVDEIRRLDDESAPPLLATSSGVHIVLPGHFIPENSGLLLTRTEDRRVVFILPWRGYTLVGTTDRPAPPSDHPLPTPEEVDYLLRHAARVLSPAPTRDDVLSAWSGIRPLVAGEKKAPTARLLREHVIVESESGLVTVAGGKWTTYRKIAEDVVNYLDRTRSLGLPPSKTKELPLIGAEGYSEALLSELEKLTEPETARHLLSTYGALAERVLEFARQKGELAKLLPGHPHLLGEVRWAARFELAETPLDFLLVRSRLAYSDQRAALEALPAVVRVMAEEKGWSPREAKAQEEAARRWLELAP